MLFWTCPECGRECSPEIRECPACVRAHAAPPAPLILAANGQSASATGTLALLEEEPKAPAGGAIDSLVRPLVESVVEPTQLALPGLEALVASQVEAEITSRSAEPTAAPADATVPAAATSAPPEAPVESAVVAPVTESSAAMQAVAAPIESAIVAPLAESAEVATLAPTAVESIVVAPVTESTEAAPPVVATIESAVVAPPAESAEVATLAPTAVESIVVAPVTESTEATQPVAAPIESSVVAPPAESAEVAPASAPADAPVESIVVTPVTESTEVATAAAPAEAVAPTTESAEVAVASALAGVSVESTEATQPVVATIESAVVAPPAESPAVASAPTAVESVIVAPVTESTEATQPVVATIESAVVAPPAESPEVVAVAAPTEASVEPTEVATGVAQRGFAARIDSPVARALLPAASALVPTLVFDEPPSKRSHESERGTHECVRHQNRRGAQENKDLVVQAEAVAPATESAEVAVASAPAEAPVESVVVAPVTESTDAMQPVVAIIESAVVAPATESPEVPAPSAPAEAPVESEVAAPTSESIGTTVAAPTAESVQLVAAPIETSVVAPQTLSAEVATTTTSVDPSVESGAVAPAETTDQARLSAALKLQAEAVLDAIALQAEVDHSGILAIRESFRESPATSLLSAPLKLVTAPAPPTEQWKRTARPAIPSRKPNDPKPALLSSGPLVSTLAGPCLPRELRTFTEDRSSAKARTRKRAGFPTWMVSLVVATFLFLGAGSLLQYVTGNREAKAAAPASGQSSASPSGDRHPFAKFVEVTGLRVIADQNHKSQLQYIVVNHSSAQISGMAIRIAVRSAAGSSETAPLFVVSASVPSLAPYQSKEIRTGLDAELRYSAIPDWENLRADVQVNTQE